MCRPTFLDLLALAAGSSKRVLVSRRCRDDRGNEAAIRGNCRRLPHYFRGSGGVGGLGAPENLLRHSKWLNLPPSRGYGDGGCPLEPPPTLIGHSAICCRPIAAAC